MSYLEEDIVSADQPAERQIHLGPDQWTSIIDYLQQVAGDSPVHCQLLCTLHGMSTALSGLGQGLPLFHGRLHHAPGLSRMKFLDECCWHLWENHGVVLQVIAVLL